jgi:cell wall-associated NlpC family hydrolase
MSPRAILSRPSLLSICFLSTLLALLFSLTQPASADTLQDGDIIFQVSRSPQGVAIQKATGSKYNHMGIVINRSGFPQVFEAAGKVRYTPLSSWIRRGVGGRYVVKRLRHADDLLNGEMLSKLRRVAEELRGRPYDPWFEWSDERIYCSELVWKIYKRALDLEIGRLQKLRELNLTDPVVRKELQKRYGGRIPLNEKVITPAAMFNSKDLVTVEKE